MNFQQLLDSMTPPVYAAMKRAVEIGKWPDQRLLSAQERETCLQAIIAYEARTLPEQARSGFIDRSVCGSGATTAPQDGSDHGRSSTSIDIKPI